MVDIANLTPLRPGDELSCPRCRHWHRVTARHTAGTDYTQRMLYWQCDGQAFYAGQIGTTARYPTRRPRLHTT